MNWEDTKFGEELSNATLPLSTIGGSSCHVSSGNIEHTQTSNVSIIDEPPKIHVR